MISDDDREALLRAITLIRESVTRPEYTPSDVLTSVIFDSAEVAPDHVIDVKLSSALINVFQVVTREMPVVEIQAKLDAFRLHVVAIS
jgi:hypothetical protein